MKKINHLLIFLTCLVGLTAHAQFPSKQTIGTKTTLVHANGGFIADSALILATRDTTNHPGNTYAGALDVFQDIVWYRDNTATYWIPLLSAASFANSNTITFSGDGSPPNPIAAHVNISTQVAPNAIQEFADGIYSPVFMQNGIIRGGLVTNVVNYTYDVTPAYYVINSVPYNSPETQVTLQNADTEDRIDLLVVTTSGTVEVITGTPAASPQNPSYDPETQLPLTFIYVTANSTGPAVTSLYIYYNNNDLWTTATGITSARLNPASTNNPFSVTQDIEFTLARQGDTLRFTDPFPPTDLSLYKVITMKVRSKGTFAATSRIALQFRNGQTPTGNPIYISEGSQGFVSSNTTDYQTLTFPLFLMGAPTGVTNLFLTVNTTGSNTIGAYVDNIQLQGDSGTIIPTFGSFHQQNGNRWGTTSVIGTQDPYNINFITGNNLKATINNATSAWETYGNDWLRGSNPMVSFFLGTGANSDYYIQRQGTTLKLNTAGLYSTYIAGTEVYRVGTATGNTWYDPTTGTFQMQLDPLGNLNLGTNAANNTTLLNVSSTTKASHPAPSMTATQMNAIVAPQTYDLVVNTTAGTYYYYNGSAWVPFGGINAANNGVSLTGTTVQLGGTGSQLLGNTTITTSAFSLNIPSSSTSKTLNVSNSSSGTALEVDASSGSGNAIVAGNNSATETMTLDNTGSGDGLTIQVESGNGFNALSNTGTAGLYNIFPVSNNSVAKIVEFRRQVAASAAGANGIGVSVDFMLAASTPASILQSNQIISKYTNVAVASRTSELSFTGRNAGSLVTLLTLNGNQSIRANGYGIGSFTAGTPAYGLAVDASGNIIEAPVGGGIAGVTANNGLSASSITNVQLGGSALIQNTTISTSAFNFNILSSNSTHTFKSTNSSNGVAVWGQASGGAVSGIGVFGTTQSTGGDWINPGVQGQSSGTTPGVIGYGNGGGIGVQGYSAGSIGGEFVSEPSGSLSSTVTVLKLGRWQSAGTELNGIGGSIDMQAQGDLNHVFTANQIIWKWTTVSESTRVSELSFTGVNNAVTATLFTLAGSGQLKFNKYGINTFAGTPAYNLGVDALGNVIEVAAAGTGMTNVLTTNGDMVYGVGSTPTRLPIGTPGQLLRVNGGGTAPEWATITGTGSVTTASVVTANGFAGSVANASTTPAITLTTTITGILKGNGTAISAATAGTDYLTVLSGDATTSSNVITLATVNSNVGTFGSSTSIPTFTVNAKGLITAASGNAVIAPAGTLTGATLASGVTASSLTSHGTITSGGLGTGAVIGGVTMTLGSDASWDMYTRNASGILERVANGTTGQVLTATTSGKATWQTPAAGGGTVLDVTGTSNRITITGTASLHPVVDISSSYVGQASITTLGTIGTGTWNATAISVAKGGTSLTSITSATIPIGNGSNAWTQATPTATNGAAVTMGAGTMVISTVFNPTVQSLSDGATITWNVTNGGNAQVTLAGTGRTLSITNPVAGYTYTIRIIQGSGGSKTITTWPSGTRWQGSLAPTLSTTAGKMDVISFYYDGTNYYGTYGNDFGWLDIQHLRETIHMIGNDYENFKIAA